jgi:hypothetical protein
MRIVDRIVFRRLGERGVQEAVRPFLAAWGADSPGDLERSLGCAVSERLLVSLFSGIDSGSSRYLQAAVLAFALQHATKEDLAMCIAGEHGSSGAQDLFVCNTAKTWTSAFVRDLCRLAADAGYPVEGARALAAGQSTRRVAAPNLTRRFLGSLQAVSIDCHRDLVASRAAHAAKKTPWTRELARAKISAALRKGCSTRSNLCALEESAYRWSIKHDATWLDQTLPRFIEFRQRSWKEAGTAATRDALMAAIQEGARTRTLLRSRLSGAYRFALKHDATWLNSVVTSKRNRRPPVGGIDNASSS